MTRRSEAPWTTLSTTPIYANKWLSLREDLVALPDGRTTIYGVVSCGQCVGARRDRDHRGPARRPPAGAPRRAGAMSRARVRGAVLGLRLLAAVALAAGPAAAQDALRFPKPDRPVAQIVAPSYSTEDTRDRHGEAERVMDRLGIAPGLRVADVGAGDGYYTVRLARRLGPAATIYAQDVESRHLRGLAQRLEREGVRGVTLVQGAPADPRLPPDSVDVALLSHVYHEIENPYAFFYRLHLALASRARVAIVDVDKPTQEHGTPPALLRCELAALGYREVDFISLAPADGYLAVFVPPATLPAPGSIRPCAG
jgi:SAM-dependent methyltransferase